MRALTITLCLLATPALADVAGVASVIDGDTIEVHGQRQRAARSSSEAGLATAGYFVGLDFCRGYVPGRNMGR